MDLWTHFWTMYFEGKIRDLKVKIELYTTPPPWYPMWVLIPLVTEGLMSYNNASIALILKIRLVLDR